MKRPQKAPKRTREGRISCRADDARERACHSSKKRTGKSPIFLCCKLEGREKKTTYRHFSLNSDELQKGIYSFPLSLSCHVKCKGEKEISFTHPKHVSEVRVSESEWDIRHVQPLGRVLLDRRLLLLLLLLHLDALLLLLLLVAVVGRLLRSSALLGTVILKHE